MKGVVRMKRFVCWTLCLCLLWAGFGFALAENEEPDTGDPELEEVGQADLTDEQMREMEELDEAVSMPRVTGKVYPEPEAKDFNNSSLTLYTSKVRQDAAIYKVPDPDHLKKNILFKGQKKGMTADILYVGLQWLIVRREGKIGYVQRQWVDKASIQPVDPVNQSAFNVQKHSYTATTATYCHVRTSMSFNEGAEDDGENFVILNPGTKITIWKFYEGWAIVNYMRDYGYIDPTELTDLKPVSPTDEELFPDCPIAAYTSYYKMNQNESNISRIHNIKVGCALVSVTLQPNEIFDGNAIMGPYGARKGYEAAPVLINGTSVLGYGGGTCQVSSTLYNAVIQLPGLEILRRKPHGGNGAPYLPIHCDAAVGTDSLNFIFANRYDFPIRIEACTSDDGALSMRIYKVH